MKTEKDYEKEAKELVRNFSIKVTIDTIMDSIPTKIRDKLDRESAKHLVLICIQFAKVYGRDLEELEKLEQLIKKK